MRRRSQKRPKRSQKRKSESNSKSSNKSDRITLILSYHKCQTFFIANINLENNILPFQDKSKEMQMDEVTFMA